MSKPVVETLRGSDQAMSIPPSPSVTATGVAELPAVVLTARPVGDQAARATPVLSVHSAAAMQALAIQLDFDMGAHLQPDPIRLFGSCLCCERPRFGPLWANTTRDTDRRNELRRDQGRTGWGEARRVRSRIRNGNAPGS